MLWCVVVCGSVAGGLYRPVPHTSPYPFCPSPPQTQPSLHASPANTAIEQLHPPPTTSPPQLPPTPATLPPSLLTRLSTTTAVLYDLDGTLVESATIWYRLLHSAALHFGFRGVEYDDWKGTFGQSMEQNVDRWMKGLDQGVFNRYCDEHYADFLDDLHLLDGTIDLLTHTQQRYRGQIAIVTNCPRHITGLILSHLQLAPFFAHVVCAGDVHPTRGELKPKPATDILVVGAEKLGVGCQGLRVCGGQSV